MDLPGFLTTVGTPSLLERASSATDFNGVTGFYVAVPAAACVKFDSTLLQEDLTIRISNLTV